MDETARRAIIAGKMGRGELPKRPPSRLSAAYGAGEICDGCAQPIANGDVAYLVDFCADQAGVTLRFHQRCSDWWNAERRAEMPPYETPESPFAVFTQPRAMPSQPRR